MQIQQWLQVGVRFSFLVHDLTEEMSPHNAGYLQ